MAAEEDFLPQSEKKDLVNPLDVDKENEVFLPPPPIDDYKNKTYLAPMVRVGTLPFRLLSRRYGADCCFVEELIDRSISSCTRSENHVLNTIDFKRKDKVIFRTNREERPLIFQMGTANPVHALAAAETISRDVCGIDINMGCPKHFSISGGMGAALLKKPETVEDIVKTLSRNINLPISCKIRCLPEIKDTIALCRVIEKAGARAITVHGRRQEERSRQPPRYDEVKAVVDAGLSIPIIHNGDVLKYEDIEAIKNRTGAPSVMVARGAMWNASIFQPILLPRHRVMKDYVKMSIIVDNAYQNTKYVLTRMVGEDGNEEEMNKVRKCMSMLSLAELVGEENFYQDILRGRKPQNQNNVNHRSNSVRKREEEGGEERELKRAKIE
uniref:tRNA-dihydrouridine synthase n=1 Tax=Paramoeba aestuarina TaxID=180227 RepID=A0A7S4P623_9EUKA